MDTEIFLKKRGGYEKKRVIDEYTKCILIDMSKKVIRNLLGENILK